MSVPWYLMAKRKGGGYKTASGPIVSISDALAAPLRSLRVGIDPVQDLHGYDSPWPGGGGKQKFNIADAAINETQSVSGNTITKAHSSYNFDLLNGTTGSSSLATIKIPLAAGTYTISGTVTSEGSTGIRVYAVDSDGVVAGTYLTAINASTPFATFILAESGYITLRYSAREACTVSNIQIEPGSSATAWTPYANLCPISGWDAANLWRTGKNLLDVSDYQIETSSAYNKSAGTTLTFGGTGASVSGTNPIEIAVTTGWRGATFFSKPLKAGATYYLRYRITAPSPGYIKRTIYWVDDNNKIVVNLGYSSSVDQSAEYVYHNTLTPPQEGLRLAFVVESQTSQTITIYDMGVMVGDWENYAPYTGNQFTIQLGQTVYGGTLDVTNGVLTVDRANIASYNGETLPGEWISDRDVYAPGTTPTIGAQVVYTLATPITIPLSDITVETLAGQNVMWGDCGAVDVEYLSAGGANPDLMKLAVAFMGRK